MSSQKTLLVVWLALVAALVVVTIIPTGPKESEVVYTLRQMDDFRRGQFQREALAFHEEVRDKIALRIIELSRPYVASPPWRPELSSSIVNNVVNFEMPKWAHDELLRRGETEESITEEKAFTLLQETPGWTEMTKLHYLFMSSEELPEAVGPDTSLDSAQAWLTELRETAVRLHVLGEDKVVSAAESE